MMLMGENSRAVTEAVKAKLAADRSPRCRRGRASSRSTTARRSSTARSRPSRKNLLEGAVLVILVLLLLLGDLRAGLVVATTIPLSMLFAHHADERDRRLGQPDEPRRDRLRPDRRRRGHHRRERRAPAVGGAGARRRGRSTATSASTVVSDARSRCASASVFGEAHHRHRLPADPRADAASRGSCSARWRRRCSSRWRARSSSRSPWCRCSRATSCGRASARARDLAAAQAHRGLRARSCGAALRASLGHRWRVGAARRWRRRARCFTRLGAEFVPQLDEGDLLHRGAAAPGHRAHRVGRDRRPRSSGRCRRPRGRRTSSAGPARRRSRPIRWASSRPTSTSGSSRASSGARASRRRRSRRRSPSVVEREVPEVAGARLAADPDAHERADRRRALRRRRPDLRARLDELRSSASRSPRRSDGVPGAADVRVEQVAGLTLPAHRPRPREARALRAHRRGRQHGHRDDRGRSDVGDGARGGAALRHRRARRAIDYAGRSRRRCARCRSSPPAGRSCPLGDVAELTSSTGPA